MSIITIAVDGPAGAGKSTISKQVAKKLNISYLDTGAMYRAIGLYFKREGVTSADEICARANEPEINVRFLPDGQHTYLFDEDVTDIIRLDENSSLASNVAKFAPIRDRLVVMQRKVSASNSVIMDGRDIGTVVLPDATLKIYLDATPEERASRRLGELAKKGIHADFETVLADINKRDYNDMHRDIAPLRCADDAVYLDTTHMTMDEVVKKIISLKDEAVGGKA